MKILRRLLSWLVVLSVLLSCCVCSVSAAETDLFYWTDCEPYTDDFPLPCGEDSVICEFWTASNQRRRVVFPSGSNVVAVRDPSNGQMQFIWSADSAEDCAVVYIQESDGNFASDHYALVPPTKGSSGNYTLGTWVSYTSWNVVGYVINQALYDNDVPEPQNGQFKAFPTSSLVAEKETQGMIATLTQNIKDWFSGLIDSMGNFFDSLADKIKGFFTQLVEDIKGLFVPSDGFFDEYSDNFETWAREHFGFLFETIEIIDTTLTKLINFSPSDSATITLPKTSFSVHGQEYVLWDSVTLNFNDLLSDVSALNTLHTIYFTVVYALFFYLLYRLGEKSYNDIFGGRD